MHENCWQLAINDILVSKDAQRIPDDYKRYMAKNLFYIKFQAKNTFGTDLVKKQLAYYLSPVGFDVKEREISYCKYAIKNCPEEIRAGWEAYLSTVKNQSFIFVSEEQFLQT